jgi:hypothetical protein
MYISCAFTFESLTILAYSTPSATRRHTPYNTDGSVPSWVLASAAVVTRAHSITHSSSNECELPEHASGRDLGQLQG